MIPAQHRIFLCTQPQDMRRGFDMLACAVRQQTGEDPRCGALFCFVNKRANRLKILWWDETGYCVLYKRLHRAKFVRPSAHGAPLKIQLDPIELASLIRGVRKDR